ncbi:MAG: DUF120 domain-containing protein [Desulfobulbaceae bacterium]|nr:DUF120 domain-containing protein [Desulfobulbaceae bacterium]
MDEILFLLLKEGIFRTPLKIGTVRIGSLLKMSQQNASRRVRLLEQGGMITRTKSGLELTASGRAAIMEEYRTFSLILGKNKKDRIELKGVVVKGFGEGRYYVEKYSKLLKGILGKRPYPGTLNIRLDAESTNARQGLDGLTPLKIEGFEENGRQYGALNLYRCSVGAETAAVVVPARTHHNSDTIEVVAVKRLKKSVGDRVAVVIE